LDSNSEDAAATQQYFYRHIHETATVFLVQKHKETSGGEPLLAGFA